MLSETNTILEDIRLRSPAGLDVSVRVFQPGLSAIRLRGVGIARYYTWAGGGARDSVIYMGVLGLSVLVSVVALRTFRGSGARRYLAISALPLILTVVVPLPFALGVGGPADWARMTVVTVSRIGIALSVILFTIGAVLTLRAAWAGDPRTAVLLSVETALAGLPAGVVAAYAALIWLL